MSQAFSQPSCHFFSYIYNEISLLSFFPNKCLTPISSIHSQIFRHLSLVPNLFKPLVLLVFCPAVSPKTPHSTIALHSMPQSPRAGIISQGTACLLQQSSLQPLSPEQSNTQTWVCRSLPLTENSLWLQHTDQISSGPAPFLITPQQYRKPTSRP